MVAGQLMLVMAEDDEGHANLIRRNLQRAGVANELVHVKNGQEALDFIRCENAYSERQVNGPLMLLLDINMPQVDGVEVLRRLKSDARTSSVPVIMLTTTDDPREIQRCYELGCSSYVTKPVAYLDFVEAVKRLGLFLSIVEVPREDDHK